MISTNSEGRCLDKRRARDADAVAAATAVVLLRDILLSPCRDVLCKVHHS